VHLFSHDWFHQLPLVIEFFNCLLQRVEVFQNSLEKYVDTLESIILFGSVARGEAKEDSDIDILVVRKTFFWREI
jgi:predicted nucleotidyltransferase